MIPKRIQLRRTKGWRLPENTVVVGRPSKWGNPYKVREDLPAREAVRCFEESLLWSIAGSHCMDGNIDWMAAHLPELKGRNLACWCKPGWPCHADVLLKIANRSDTAHRSLTENQQDGAIKDF